MQNQPKHQSFLSSALHALHRLEDYLLAMLLAGMILLAGGQILLRNVFDTGITWGHPALRVMVLWLGMLGALAASRDNKHITIDLISRVVHGTLRHVAQIITCLFTSFVCGVLAYHSIRFVLLDYDTGSRGIADIPAWLLEAIMPFTFALIGVRYLLIAITHTQQLLNRTGDP